MCMAIILPQMKTFHSQCVAGFPSEDCRIYDIGYMWPILVTQTILDLIVVAIKSEMLRKAYHLYRFLHEYKSPLLNVIDGGRHFQITLPEEPSTQTD